MREAEAEYASPRPAKEDRPKPPRTHASLWGSYYGLGLAVADPGPAIINPCHVLLERFVDLKCIGSCGLQSKTARGYNRGKTTTFSVPVQFCLKALKYFLNHHDVQCGFASK
jgi:hypothetical protein